MTVLVSVVKQMIANGEPIDAVACASTGDTSAALAAYGAAAGIPTVVFLPRNKVSRSEEHTSELQSLAYLVCRLLLEKKKTTHNQQGRELAQHVDLRAAREQALRGKSEHEEYFSMYPDQK